MKHTEIEEFVQEHNLLERTSTSSGIYAITIDNQIAYIGQSRNVYNRCCQHIYGIQNAMLNKEKKYKLLLSALLGGHNVDCVQIEYCGIDELNEYEEHYIQKIMPPLNILTPEGKQDISNLTIEELLLDKMTYRIGAATN